MKTRSESSGERELEKPSCGNPLWILSIKWMDLPGSSTWEPSRDLEHSG